MCIETNETQNICYLMINKLILSLSKQFSRKVVRIIDLLEKSFLEFVSLDRSQPNHYIIVEIDDWKKKKKSHFDD